MYRTEWRRGDRPLVRAAYLEEVKTTDDRRPTTRKDRRIGRDENRMTTRTIETRPEQDQGLYNVFTRTWWTRNAAWAGGREPHMGPKSYLQRGVTYVEACRVAEGYNTTHAPGELSRKAEIERCER